MKLFLKFLFLWGLMTTNVMAQENVLDLRGKDLDTEIHTLQHQWQMVFGEFLSSEEMQSKKVKFYINTLNTWTGKEYDGKKLPATGYATFYLRVLVNENQKNLAINALVTSTNYRLYINNQFLGEIGKVGKNKEEAKPLYTNKIYKIPPHEGVLDIVYHVSNFHYRRGGLVRAPLLGKHDVLTESRAKKIAISFFLIGSIFFMGLFHLGSNLFRHKTKLAFYFSLVCFLTVLRTLSVNEYILTEYLNFPWWLSTRIEFISFFLILAFTIKFIYHMFPAFIPVFFIRAPYYIAIGASILTVFLPLFYSSYFIPFMQLTTILTGLGLLYFIAKESIKGDKEVIVALVGFIMLFGVTVIEIMLHHYRIVADLVFSSGIFLYLFSHVVIMANRLNSTHENVEKLGQALKVANTELEGKVKERTKQLDKQNKALTQSIHQLKRINEEKNGLIHVVAHDLKSPLNTNLGLIQLIKMEGGLTPDQLVFLKNLEKSNKQGVNLIDDLLILYNMESQKEANVSPIELPEYLSEMADKHRGTASLKRIEIKTELTTFSDPFFTDESLLNRILDNLISNAIKFSRSGTSVYLKARLEDEFLSFEVQDEGIGIMEKEHNKVFKKFQKMNNKPTGNESSSGLGLSIVKELVEILNGDIGFKSESGKGSTFWVKLPNLKKNEFAEI
ncbi:sensor histidine kinase [Marivirga sp. S37H4]|uniref:histidine kinase n=1 Tax=Marivirga aurantiaca TaxID=2802615 RepID=A0A935C5W3_9BACT|nr:sensor histidine kinase [Marivirga aurantiaca]MBK6264101.1 sensor histidine kinase [Marivirga aurantiaca]